MLKRPCLVVTTGGKDTKESATFPVPFPVAHG